MSSGPSHRIRRPTPRQRLAGGAGLALLLLLALAVGLALNRDGGPDPVIVALRELAKDDPRAAAFLQLSMDSRRPLSYRFEDGFPLALHFQVEVGGADSTERARAYLQRYADLYGLQTPGFDLGLRRVQRGRSSDKVVFYQKYRDLEVYGAELVVHVAGPVVLATAGALLPLDPRLSLDPVLSRADAERIARSNVAGAAPRVIGDTRLVVFDGSLLGPAPPDPRLAWRVAVTGNEAFEFVIDARSGDVLLSGPLSPTGTFDDYDLDLEDAENDSNASESSCYYWSDETEVGDADGIIAAYQQNDIKSQDAGAAWSHMRNTYKFFKETFHRTGWDDLGSEHDVYIRAKPWGSGGPNASFSECVLVQFTQRFITFDIMVHEFTHAVVFFTSNLNNGIESKSVNEAMADIMAAIAEQSWLLGEKLDPQFGGPLRSLADPPSLSSFNNPNMPDPDQYSEIGNEEHFNAGIINKAAFLITQGGLHPGTGIFVFGIGFDKADELFYDVLTGLPSSAPMIVVRDTAVAEVESSLYWNKWLKDNPNPPVQWGFPTKPNHWTDFDLCQVKNGFKAVELGSGDLDCDGKDDALDFDDDNDGIPDSKDTCPEKWNPWTQQDTDGDGKGDVCDDDDDNDGVKDANDNCPLVANPNQADSDQNGVGNACQDTDKDGIIDTQDNCPNAANPGQENWDGDAAGDVCDPDDDNDGVLDDVDNCPKMANPGQANKDGDQFGDACDNCVDVPDKPGSILQPNGDKDGDGIGDICDPSPNGPGIIDLGQYLDLLEAIGRGDGSTRELRVQAPPRSLLTLPLPLCAGDACADAAPVDQCFALELAGLEGQIGAIIGDDTGMGRARLNRNRAQGSLRFQPRGGREYSLTLYFGPNFDGDATLSLTSSLCVKPAGDAADPTAPGTGAATATPSPAPGTAVTPAGSSVTAAPAGATATPRPGATPTPAAATRTATAAPRGATATATPAPAPVPATATTLPPTSTLQPQATATHTPRPAPAATPTPTPRPAPTATPTPTPRLPNTPTHTSTPRLAPTPTPTPRR